MRIVTPYDPITEKLIQAAYRVHDELGGGFAEVLYENARSYELQGIGLSFERQKRLQVFYREQVVGEFVVDLVVERAVLVELKAVKEITDEHRAQAINYLTCTKLPVGQIFNYGRTLTFQRLLNSRLIPDSGQST